MRGGDNSGGVATATDYSKTTLNDISFLVRQNVYFHNELISSSALRRCVPYIVGEVLCLQHHSNAFIKAFACARTCGVPSVGGVGGRELCCYLTVNHMLFLHL